MMYVYYSKTWRDIRHEKNNKETIYKNGECDFVIVWPQYGILVIECLRRRLIKMDNSHQLTETVKSQK